jgi:hypothetical protein
VELRSIARCIQGVIAKRASDCEAADFVGDRAGGPSRNCVISLRYPTLSIVAALIITVLSTDPLQSIEPLSMTSTEPTLLFFRHRPAGWETNALVASSLQSVETSFFLIALGRYPHALTACVSAIETCLQAARIGSTDTDGLLKLLRKAQNASSAVAGFSADLLIGLRETRNRFTHRGFCPEDDNESVSLYLDAGLPFLSLCYREFHNFDFEHGLLMEYADHLSLAKRVHALAAETPDLDLSYCLNTFGHLIRSCFKQNFSAGWELEALVGADDTERKFKRIQKEKYALESLFEATWSFDCPLCDDIDSVIAELEAGSLEAHKICVRRLACISCDFFVADSQPYLSDILLEKQIAKSRSAILNDYGIG